MDPLYKIFPPLPSICNHLEKWIGRNKSVCLRCGRTRVVVPELDLTLFYFNNGILYFRKRGGLIKDG